MAEQSRTGRHASDTATIASGNGSPLTVLDLRDEQTLEIGLLKLEYAGGATSETKVTLYDEADGTSQGDLADEVDVFHLSPGERAIVDVPVYEYVEADIVAVADGIQDGEVTVTVAGSLITG